MELPQPRQYGSGGMSPLMMMLLMMMQQRQGAGQQEEGGDLGAEAAVKAGKGIGKLLGVGGASGTGLLAKLGGKLGLGGAASGGGSLAATPAANALWNAGASAAGGGLGGSAALGGAGIGGAGGGGAAATGGLSGALGSGMLGTLGSLGLVASPVLLGPSIGKALSKLFGKDNPKRRFDAEEIVASKKARYLPKQAKQWEGLDDEGKKALLNEAHGIGALGIAGHAGADGKTARGLGEEWLMPSGELKRLLEVRRKGQTLNERGRKFFSDPYRNESPSDWGMDDIVGGSDNLSGKAKQQYDFFQKLMGAEGGNMTMPRPMPNMIKDMASKIPEGNIDPGFQMNPNQISELMAALQDAKSKGNMQMLPPPIPGTKPLVFKIPRAR